MNGQSSMTGRELRLDGLGDTASRYTLIINGDSVLMKTSVRTDTLIINTK